jgi:hypothetical protein
MLEVQKEGLKRALIVLNGLGAQYKIILLDGTEYGDLVVAPKAEEKKRKRKPSLYPHGALQNYFQPILEALRPGDAAEVPAQQFDIESLRGSMTAWAGKTWGRKTFISRSDKTRNVVEFLRME